MHTDAWYRAENKPNIFIMLAQCNNQYDFQFYFCVITKNEYKRGTGQPCSFGIVICFCFTIYHWAI